VENVSLFRVEESEVERDLRAMLGLTSPDDPEPVVSAPEPRQESLEEPHDPTQDVELATSSRSMHGPAPQVPNPRDPPVQPSNDMQVDRPNITPINAQPQDQTPTKGVPPVHSTPATTEFSEGLPLAPDPAQLPSWNPFGFVGDEDDEEEEIPSINMDSDSN
jgi:hypothetical protein